MLHAMFCSLFSQFLLHFPVADDVKFKGSIFTLKLQHHSTRFAFSRSLTHISANDRWTVENFTSSTVSNHEISYAEC